MDTAELLDLPLVAVSSEECEAWLHLLQDERPRRLMQVSRATAWNLVTEGEALTVANIAHLRAIGDSTSLRTVSRRHVWPGAGTWASVSKEATARFHGLALCRELQAVFGAPRSSPEDEQISSVAECAEIT
ncbi:MAG: hypothetical protein AAGI10_07180 [Pseudomonadota bacterium]